MISNLFESSAEKVITSCTKHNRSKIRHESLSFLLMKELNKQFGGKLDLAIRIFQNTYPKKFLHQLVSSQLDVDRLDYLNRDSFFTGVTEGVVGAERIINMLNVVLIIYLLVL